LESADVPHSSAKTAKSNLQHLLQRLTDNAQGVAAVEFAMIAPLMFFLFVGAIEYSQAIAVDRRVSQSASAMADLVARAPSEGVTAQQIDRDLSLVNQLIAPYELSPLTVEVVSVKAVGVPGNPNAVNYVVDWSRNNHNGTPYARNTPAPFGMPQGLLVAGESAIVGRAFYDYTPMIFTYFIREVFTLEEKFYLKPRNSACVHLKPIHCVTGATM
jgi:Flp pilus assembly protein TadG